MSANLSALLYLVAGVLFILSLRGLSSPASSRQGNFFGMIGMGIAVATTLASHPPADGLAWLLVILGVAIGGGIGAVIARRAHSTRPRPSTSGYPATSIRRAWLKCRSALQSAR